MPIHNLNFSKLRTEGNFLNLPKSILKNSTANNKLNGKKLNNLPLSRNEIKMLTPSITIVHYTGGLNQRHEARKKGEKYKNWKGRHQTVVFTEGISMYI